VNIKKELLGILFGALLFSIAIQTGFISPANNMLENVLNATILLVLKVLIVTILTGFKS
jgi:hypothetical protein